MQSIEKTIKSALPPTLTNVFWLDISGEKPILKAFKNGKWLPVSSEDPEVEELEGRVGELEEGKVDKMEGKELSSNDFTDELKEKLETLDETAEGIHIKPDWNAQSGESGEILNRPGVDNVPTLNSNNLVKSGGVAEKIGQLGQEVGKTYIQTEPLVVSASNQTIRADFNLTNRGTFKILFDGGVSNITGIKVALYKDVLSAQGLVYNSSVFGFNQQIEYSGDEFNMAIFTVYANNVLTAGNATIVINTGMAAGIVSNVDAIKNNADKSLSNMFYTKGYLLSGGASYDTNGLVIRANITWSDGVTGILNKSIWDDSVLEYKRDIVSHGSQSVQYDRQYNEMGEVSKETISIN